MGLYIHWMIIIKLLDMTTELVYFKIPKKRVLSLIPVKRECLRLPEGNRYFSRVKQDRGVLASSVSINQEEERQDHKGDWKVKKGESRNAVTRSASMNLDLNRVSMKSEHKKLPQMHSLPKIWTKDTENTNPSQIIKSQLSFFNFNDISKRKGVIQKKRLRGGNLTRLSSFVSQDDLLMEKEGNTQQLQKQVDYDYYDRALMQQEPINYRPRVFKMRHKADWSICKG